MPWIQYEPHRDYNYAKASKQLKKSNGKMMRIKWALFRREVRAAEAVLARY